jgi:hypothetical protein
LIANLTHMVTYSVLVHNGFFKEMARIGLGLTAAMTCLGAVALFTRLEIVQFLEAYAAIYCCGALVAVVMMIRGPFRLAHETKSGATVTSRPAPAARTLGAI